MTTVTPQLHKNTAKPHYVRTDCTRWPLSTDWDCTLWSLTHRLYSVTSYLQIVLCERAPTPGSLRFASALPTSHCVTPSLMRRCLNLNNFLVRTEEHWKKGMESDLVINRSKLNFHLNQRTVSREKYDWEQIRCCWFWNKGSWTGFTFLVLLVKLCGFLSCLLFNENLFSFYWSDGFCSVSDTYWPQYGLEYKLF